MLINCPECRLQVSDKAYSCPHCGYPLKSITPRDRKSNRKKKLPNGFGQITFLKGRNLRNPYRVMVTVGHNENGRPISKILQPNGYFKTYNEAYEALVAYRLNPYDLSENITVKELYNRWLDSYFRDRGSESSKNQMNAAWNYCSEVYNMRVRDVRIRHIKGVMFDGLYNGHRPSAGTSNRIKTLFNLMFDYAVEYELVDRNYARSFSVSEPVIKEATKVKKAHVTFTDDEISTIWTNRSRRWVKVILIQIYTGLRPQELGLIKKSDVNFETNIITTGMKTEAGTNRPIPIHSCILEFIKEFYNEAPESEWLINYLDGYSCRDTQLTYRRYDRVFKEEMDAMNITDHRAHDCRKHFVTMAKQAGMDEYALKRIVGHNITDITEKVYTDRSTDWLIKEVEKIRGPVD